MNKTKRALVMFTPAFADDVKAKAEAVIAELELTPKAELPKSDPTKPTYQFSRSDDDDGRMTFMD